MGESLVKDSNFLKEFNVKHLWHPMAHPADMRANAPHVLSRGAGVRFADLDGNAVINAAGAQWNMDPCHSCDPGRDIPLSPSLAISGGEIEAIISVPGTGLSAA